MKKATSALPSWIDETNDPELTETMRKNDALLRQRSSSRWMTGFMLALVFAAGCGDSSDGTAGAGGSGGTTGDAGGGAAAGSRGDSGTVRDGPVPPAAQASVSLHLTDMDIGAARCAPGRQWVNAPSTPTAVQVQQTSGTDPGATAVDGVDGNHVTCAVRKRGDKFTFSGDATTRRTDGTNILHPTVLHFEANAITPSGPPTAGIVTAMTDTTGGNFEADTCSFSVSSPSSELAVDSGKIWASVTCDLLADPTSPGDGCRLDVGFLVFENCAQ